MILMNLNVNHDREKTSSTNWKSWAGADRQFGPTGFPGIFDDFISDCCKVITDNLI